MMSALTFALAACLVVWAIDQARHMSRRTCNMLRLGVILIGASSMGAALLPLYQRPHWLMPALMAGIAIFLWADRREVGRR